MSVESVPRIPLPTVHVTILGPLRMSVAGLSAPTIVEALQRVTSAPVVLTHQSHPVSASSGSGSGAACLTERERQVLKLVAVGLRNRDIADRLFLSINTVKSYIRSSYQKIGVTSRSQAVLWALSNGVQVDDGEGTGTGADEVPRA